MIIGHLLTTIMTSSSIAALMGGGSNGPYGSSTMDS